MKLARPGIPASVHEGNQQTERRDRCGFHGVFAAGSVAPHEGNTPRYAPLRARPEYGHLPITGREVNSVRVWTGMEVELIVFHSTDF